ncbi:conserved CBS domain protein [Angomonas deanei]|nr:conserved CBS domain protein [Angomonas deanei]|eukprot:EPY42391.1 conserved CBS domain protein [Angomonas deanei]
MLSTSTQVVVLDVDAPLAVAFIAAQETRVQSCVLWDTKQKIYVGVLTSTDYMQILLFCVSNPDKADAVSTWSIAHWRKMKGKMSSTQTVVDHTGTALEVDIFKRGRPDGLVSCTTDSTLCECLQIMKEKDVRRIVGLAEKEGEAFSVVSMMDVEQIVEFLGVMFFCVEKNQLGGQEEEDEEKPQDAPSDSDESSSKSQRAGSGGDLLHPGRETEREARKPPSVFSIGDTLLSPKLCEMLSQAGEDGLQSEKKVGPYTSIFDIPFCFIENVGVHRHQVIYVLLDQHLHEALSLLLYYNVESVAVVDSAEGLHIIDVISRSDLLRMEDQGVYNTLLTVREALASKLKDKIFVFYEQDSLRSIFAHFVHQRVKELFMVDPATGKLQGQINISEFVFLLAFGG